MIQIDTLVFNSFQVNTYLVSDETRQCLVIDAAFYSKEERQKFENFVSENQLKVTGQINTHCHVDHILGSGYLKSRFNCQFSAHEKESPLLANAPFMGDMFGLTMEPIEGIDHILGDRENITFGKHILQSIHVPGHSPGSLAFYSAEGGFVITGDALFQGSIGRTDLPGGDYDTLIRSIRSRLLILPSETRVYPGHGPPTTISSEIADNPYLSVVK